ncbi:serine/threonine-protein kinase, partial [Ramlibacter sp. AN1015]|uniref:serine/threonine-protein kinase n=1 Tax=Ramlibacter sp. AN1015 TaxID=3133428 RepID=UPI0030C57687
MSSVPPRSTLDGLQLLRVIASSPGRTVHEACDPASAQRLAVCRCPAPAAPPTPEAQARLRAAGMAAAVLEHPNLVAVRDCGWHGEAAYVTTAFVEGETTAAYLARVGRLPPLHGLALAVQLLSALEFAHAHGLVHAAIHPEHLLVSRTGQLKLTGFGWSALAAGALRPGPFDDPRYLAPEQAAGQPCDSRCDLYAAAVVAFELITGVHPFESDAFGRGEPAQRQEPRTVRTVRRGLPTALDAVFRRALAPDPHD